MQHSIYGTLLLCLLLMACNRVAVQDSVLVFHHGDTIIVPASSPVRTGLTIDSTSVTDFSSSFETVGTVRAEAGKLAEVSVPMDGRTGQCFVHPGSHVRAGQSLFAFYSAEFADIVRSWFEARSNCDLASHNLTRKELLRMDGVVSERELEEARNEAELARRALHQAEQSLAVLGVDTTRLQCDGELRIIAPISGEVMRCEVTNGQFVRSDDPSLITIADLNNVWVTAQIKEQYIRSVHDDDRVTVLSDAYPEFPFEGQIVYIGGLVDETTRTIDVTLRVANPQLYLKPGMYVRVAFTSAEQPTLIIPADAIMQGQKTYVYRSLNDSTFVPQPVSVRSVDAGRVEVINGLQPGERIITKGGFYLVQ